jgi:heme oxygenase
MPALAASAEHETTVRTCAVSPIRARLREATADAHAALDARLQSLDLTTRAGYGRFLGANAAALLPVECALEAAGVHDVLPGWDDHARSRAMYADLDLLGISPRPVAAADAALNRARILGALYVLEGSRLGAKFLVRQVTRSTDPLVREATSYLRHGEGRNLWASFLALLEREDPSAAEEAEMIAGAQWAFSRFAEGASRA